MKRFRTSVIVGALVTGLLGASQVGAAEKPQFSGFLEDYSKLKPQSGTGMKVYGEESGSSKVEGRAQ